MKNIFNLNEEEKKRIKRLHQINEDAGMDTPGGNPDYFYGDGSLDKIRRFAQQQDEIEMSKEAIIQELVAIYSYSQDGATDLVNSSLENLLSNLGHFKSE